MSRALDAMTDAQLDGAVASLKGINAGARLAEGAGLPIPITHLIETNNRIILMLTMDETKGQEHDR